KYLLPTYSGTGASLVTTTAAVTLAPTSGSPGSAFTVNGAGFPPNDTITLTFKDSVGTTTSLGTTSTDAAGTFTKNVAVPAGAASGSATVSAKSALVGVQAGRTFNVT